MARKFWFMRVSTGLGVAGRHQVVGDGLQLHEPDAAPVLELMDSKPPAVPSPVIGGGAKAKTIALLDPGELAADTAARIALDVQLGGRPLVPVLEATMMAAGVRRRPRRPGASSRRCVITFCDARACSISDLVDPVHHLPRCAPARPRRAAATLTKK